MPVIMQQMRNKMQGKELRAARNDLGISQFTLAVKLGVSHSAVYRWERSETAPVPRKIELAMAQLIHKTTGVSAAGAAKAAAQTAKATARAAADRTKHRRDPRNHRDQDAWSKCYCDTCGASWKAVRLNANGDHRLDLVDKGDGSCDRPS